MRAFFCDHFEIALPPGHRFPLTKYQLLRERLLEDGVLAAHQLEESGLVDRPSLLLAHAPDYVDAVFSGTLDGAALRRLGFPWSEGLVARSRASGEVVEDAEAVAVVGEGVVRAAGEVAAEAVAQRLAGGGHGAEDGAKNFPFHKERSRLDVELPDHCGDTEYLEQLERHLPRVLDEAGAQILFFQAGVDPLAEDALGRLDLTLDGLRRRDRMVLQAARARGLPLVLTLGGGYARPIELSVRAHLGTWLEARQAFGA